MSRLIFFTVVVLILLSKPLQDSFGPVSWEGKVEYMQDFQFFTEKVLANHTRMNNKDWEIAHAEYRRFSRAGKQSFEDSFTEVELKVVNRNIRMYREVYRKYAFRIWKYRVEDFWLDLIH